MGSTSVIAAAITAYYLLSGTLILCMGEAFDRFGPRRVVLLGLTALAAGVAGLTMITEPRQLYGPFLVMAVGWAALSGAAITIIVAPWFEHKRGLAVSGALNGGSCGGMLIVPLLWLIAHVGCAPDVAIALATMLVVLVPSVITVLRRHPEELGLWPDGERPPAHTPSEARSLRPAPPASPWRRTTALRQVKFWTISIPFALGLAAQVGFLYDAVGTMTSENGETEAGQAANV